MGAGGSVIQLNEDAPSLIDAQDTPIPEKSEFPSNAISMGSPNMKSKFPSITSPSKLDSKQKEKESAQLSFKVEIAMDIPYLRSLELSRIYLLKVSVESLDLVIEGLTGPDTLIVQFPYQNISSWGSSPSAFQFTVFNLNDAHTPSLSRRGSCNNKETNGEEVKKAEEKEKLQETNERAVDMENVPIVTNDDCSVCSYPEMKQHESNKGIKNQRPRSQSQQAADADGKNICNEENRQSEKGGHSEGTEKDGTGVELDGVDVVITLKTIQAVLIEQTTMIAVQKLMFNMEKSAVSKQDFEQLIEDIVDPRTQGLQSNYEEIILRYSKTRAFLAKQAMDILVIVGPHSPFEKYDLACLLYTKVLNKGSFQLVVNTFEDVNDRENLIHRLKLNNKGKGFKQGENSLVASCTTLQMNRKFSQ